MSQQRENLERVSEKIAGHVRDFCIEGKTFHVEELQQYVKRYVPDVAPDSPGRILRDLRTKGAINYKVLSRQNSKYLVLGPDDPLSSPEPRAPSEAPPRAPSPEDCGYILHDLRTMKLCAEQQGFTFEHRDAVLHLSVWLKHRAALTKA